MEHFLGAALFLLVVGEALYYIKRTNDKRKASKFNLPGSGSQKPPGKPGLPLDRDTDTTSTK